MGTNNDLCDECHPRYIANNFLAEKQAVALITGKTWVEFMESPSVHAQQCANAAADQSQIQPSPATKVVAPVAPPSISLPVPPTTLVSLQPPPTIAPTAPPSTLANSTGKHIMISYCWTQKELVRALATFLRENHGYDVWTDELGSQVCGKMAGRTDAKMAEAVEKSHTVLVFVSREYNASVNCQKEAEYAHQRKYNGKVNIRYVMMQADYTTVSQPHCIEGQMGLWIGTELWYPLFDRSQIASTGIALAELIGEQGKLITTPGISDNNEVVQGYNPKY